MRFLFRSDNHFNAANIITMSNIVFGLLALFFITHHAIWPAVIFSWLGGAMDILDGKIARKLQLSNEFGIQLDSYADFISFVLAPVFFIYTFVYTPYFEQMFFMQLVAGIVSIFYIISALRRLITFNINADAGDVDAYFTGIPTPLGAILLFVLFLSSYFLSLSVFIVIAVQFVIALLLNSNIKIKHL